MRIVHLSSCHSADDNRIFKMCRSIAGAGHDVSFVVPAERDEFADGVAIKAVPIAPTLLRRLVLCTWRVYRRAAKERADVYHFHDPELIFAGLALRYFHKCDVIYDIHENMPDQIMYRASIPRGLRKWVAFACDLVERYAVKRFSAAVTANEDISERFRQVNSRVIEVHNYAEADEFRHAADKKDSRFASGVIFHSAASDRTAFSAVLQALQLIPKELSFKVVATGNTTAASRRATEMVRSTGCEHVDVVGPLSRAEMVDVMSKAAITLVLYSEQLNHASIRANRFYESLAAALPVITSDFPEWRAAVESIGCGLVADPSDPRAIADAIAYLLSNPAEAAAMGRRGQQVFLKSYSWEHETAKLLQLYGELAAAAPRVVDNFPQTAP